MTNQQPHLVGTLIYKGSKEYHPTGTTGIFGEPYYLITQHDQLYYLWELDMENPDACQYNLIKEGPNFPELHDLAETLNAPDHPSSLIPHP